MLIALGRALRPHQWVKNLFVLAPAVFAHRLLVPATAWRAALAFGVFCAAASAVYLINDVKDRDEDRRHPVKCRRPIASGALPIGVALVAAAVLATASLVAAVALGREFAVLLVAYLLLNALYSWRLKQMVILDVMAISLGFVFRVEAGGAAAGVPVSSWLALCTVFLALFLAFSKRRHELGLVAEEGGRRQVLSHYSPVFLDQMINVVTASTVVSYALYTQTSEAAAKHGKGFVYTVPFVLFGIFRYLYIMYQRPSELSPTEQLLKDVPFIANLALWGATVFWILYGL